MPDWKSLVGERLAPLRLQAPAELDLTVEVAQHLEDYYRELCSGGTSEEEAYQRTLSELDDVYPLRAELERSDRMAKYDAVPAGDARPGNFMEDLWRDLRYGGRAIRKSPLFALAAVLCLGVGIGANATVFTIINTLLLHPLPPASRRAWWCFMTPRPNMRGSSGVSLGCPTPISTTTWKGSSASSGRRRSPGHKCSRWQEAMVRSACSASL